MTARATPPTRAEVHALLDALPDEDLVEAWRRLAELGERRMPLALLLAPVDDEPLDAEDLEALEEARRERERGETIPLEEAWAAFRSRPTCPGE